MRIHFCLPSFNEMKSLYVLMTVCVLIFYLNSGWGACSSVEGTEASCQMFVKLCQVSSRYQLKEYLAYTLQFDCNPLIYNHVMV